MAEIKITPQMINEYRIKIGNYVLSDSTISEMIIATLASDAKNVRYNASSSNLFGFGFNTDNNMGMTFERTTDVLLNNNEIGGNFSSPSSTQNFIGDLNSKSSSEMKREKIYIKPFNLDNFIEELGLDANCLDKEKILDRIDTIKPFFEIYGISIDGKIIKEVLEANNLELTFDNISNIMELLYGVTLRNQEELEATKEVRNKIVKQIQTANLMEYVFNLSAEWNDQYTDSLGLFGIASEGLGYIMNKIGIDGQNHYQWADSCRKWAEKASSLSVLNSEKFEEEFKKIYNDDGEYGIEYDEEKFNQLLELFEQEKIVDKDGNLTKEGKETGMYNINIHEILCNYLRNRIP